MQPSAILIACVILMCGCATTPAPANPLQARPPTAAMMVKGNTPAPATSGVIVASDRPVPRTPAKADPAVAIEGPEVDLRPPPAGPLIILTRSAGDWPEDFTLEIGKDGAGRFIGRHYVCAIGERTFKVPSDTLEEAKRIALESHAFDRPTSRCSEMTDSPTFEIYFSEPPPGRKVGGGFCGGDKPRVSPSPVFRLGAKLQHLLDVKGWIGAYPNCKR